MTTGIKDPKAGKRRYLMKQEISRDCLRYKHECKELGSRQETEEEKRERLKKKICKQQCEERWKLHI